MIAYPARFKPEGRGFVVTFPDVPEAITEGDSEQEAMDYARDALESTLSIYMDRRREIPRPSSARGKQIRVITLPLLSAAKIRLYDVMRASGIRKADLARRLGCQKSQIDRLLDLQHASRFEQLEDAFRVLGKQLTIDVKDAA